MKKFKFIALIFAVMTTLPVLQSCLDDDDHPSDLLAVGTIDLLGGDGKEFYFTLDNGKKMYPDNAQGWNNTKWVEGQRAFVIFNKLEEPVKGYDFRIRVKGINPILTKEIVAMGEDDNNEEKIGDDKINTTYMWINRDNEYLTIEFQYYGTHSADKKHLLNLVINAPRETAPAAGEEHAEDEYINLEFRHNSGGDYPQCLGEGYVSFKLDKIKERMEGKKGVRIRVNTIYGGPKTYEVDFP